MPDPSSLVDVSDRDILQMAITLYPGVVALNYPRDQAILHSLELAEKFVTELQKKRAQEAEDAAHGAKKRTG
jgi:multisubunit Na+/H+ antiporter MnhE subunit